MTRTAIKRAFEKLDATSQADVLRELAAALAASLLEADQADARVFAGRRHEEPRARPLAEVRARLNANGARRRARAS